MFYKINILNCFSSRIFVYNKNINPFRVSKKEVLNKQNTNKYGNKLQSKNSYKPYNQNNNTNTKQYNKYGTKPYNNNTKIYNKTNPKQDYSNIRNPFRASKKEVLNKQNTNKIDKRVNAYNNNYKQNNKKRIDYKTKNRLIAVRLRSIHSRGCLTIMEYLYKMDNKFKYIEYHWYSAYEHTFKIPFYMKNVWARKIYNATPKKRMVSKYNLLLCNIYYTNLYSTGFFENAALQYYNPRKYKILPLKSKSLIRKHIKSLKSVFIIGKLKYKKLFFLSNYSKDSFFFPNINNYVSFFNINKINNYKKLKNIFGWKRVNKHTFVYKMHLKWNNLNLLYLDRFRQTVCVNLIFKFSYWYSIYNLNSNILQKHKYNIYNQLNYNNFKLNLEHVLDTMKCYNLFNKDIYKSLFRYNKRNNYLTFINRKRQLNDFNFFYKNINNTQLNSLYYTKKQVNLLNMLQLNKLKTYFLDTYIKDTSFFFNLKTRSFSYTNHIDEKYNFLSTNYINNKLILKSSYSLQILNKKVSFLHPFNKLLSNTNISLFYKNNSCSTFFYNHTVFKYYIFILKDNKIHFFKDFFINKYIFLMYSEYLHLNVNSLNFNKDKKGFSILEILLPNEYSVNYNNCFSTLRNNVNRYSLLYINAYIFIYKFLNISNTGVKQYMKTYNLFYKKKLEYRKERSYFKYLTKNILTNKTVLNGYIKRLKQHLKKKNRNFNTTWTLEERGLVIQQFKDLCLELLEGDYKKKHKVNKKKTNKSNNNSMSNSFLVGIRPIYRNIINIYTNNRYKTQYYNYISKQKTSGKVWNKYILNKNTKNTCLLKYITLLHSIKNNLLNKTEPFNTLFYSYSVLQYIKFKELYLSTFLYSTINKEDSKEKKNTNYKYLDNNIYNVSNNIYSYVFEFTAFYNIIHSFFYYLKKFVLFSNLLNSFSKYNGYILITNLDIDSFFTFKNKNTTEYNINSLLELELKNIFI